MTSGPTGAFVDGQERSGAGAAELPAGAVAEIGVLGGSGFYTFLDHPQRVAVDTPFGPPSAEVTIGEIGGRSVAFLPRHGDRHQFPPHRVNYRANLWALRSVGVRQVLAPGAVGSLRADLGPGSLVVPDQVVDRTHGRADTVYDAEGPVVHVGFADPYCPRGRRTVVTTAAQAGRTVTDGGTLVVINGPRFSSRAESAWYIAQGWSVIGMTGIPEATIARELALCYTAVSLVTDHDAGVVGDQVVSHRDVLRIFAANLDGLKVLLGDVIAGLPAYESDQAAVCPCRRALDGLPLPFELP